MFKRLLLTAASGAMLLAPVALADHEAPKPCHDHCEIVQVNKRVWVPHQYRTISTREWVPARFRTVSTREWIPARFTTVRDRRYVPARYRYQRVAVRNRWGHVIGFRMVRVRVPGTGRWIISTRRVQVAGTGRYVTRHTREQIPGTGRWITRAKRVLVPGTGQFVIRTEHRMVCHTVEFVATPIRATGLGAPHESLCGTQARLMAIRAARLDAARKLTEQLFGLKIRAHTTLKDLVLTSDLVATRVEGLVQGAREVELTENADGTFSVRLEIEAAALRTLVTSLS